MLAKVRRTKRIVGCWELQHWHSVHDGQRTVRNVNFEGRCIGLSVDLSMKDGAISSTTLVELIYFT